jgi:hypothetical protein
MTNGIRRGEGSASRPGRSLPLGKTRYPLYRRLGGPQDRSGQLRKISPPPGFELRTVQPVANRYTDWATRPTTQYACCLTLILLMWRIEWAPSSILIYIQQDATLHSLFISGNCSTCFGCYFHPSSGAHTTVFTASGICHIVTAICRYRGRVGIGLSVLWVTYAIYLYVCPVYLSVGCLVVKRVINALRTKDDPGRWSWNRDRNM